MSTLEKVMQLKQQGVPEWDIIQSLRQQGISPREINEALSQSSIKNAVSDQEVMEEIPMQPSIMQQNIPLEQQNTYAQQDYSQQAFQENYPAQDYQEPYQNQAYPSQQQYYPEYQPQQQVDVETINDIAEQIAEEKSEKLKIQIASIARIKEELVGEVKRIDIRLTKIENTMESLQMAILKKIGSYGQDIQNISKEMHQTQESFSKLINPVIDNIVETKRTTKNQEEPETVSSRKKSKTKPDFEDYLR